MSKTYKLVASAVLVAFGVLLPLVFHLAGTAGQIFLPMHIPVLLAGTPAYAAETSSYNGDTIPELLRQSACIDIQSRALTGDNPGRDGQTPRLRHPPLYRVPQRPSDQLGRGDGRPVHRLATIPLNTVEKIQIIKGASVA